MNAHSRYVSYHIISSPSLHLPPSSSSSPPYPLFPLSPLHPLHSPTSFLDLSFNHITCIENLEGLLILEKLFLIQNKISRIENLSSLTCLTLLELGSNRIRVSGRSERHTEALSIRAKTNILNPKNQISPKQTNTWIFYKQNLTVQPF